MRPLTLLLGLFVAAYLIGRLVLSMPGDDCRTDPDCDTRGAASSAIAPRADLRVVLYNPGDEPRIDAAAAPYITGWTSSEDDATLSTAALSTADMPMARGPALFEVVGLGRAGATGACVVMQGRELRCVALLDPAAESTASVLP